MDLARAQAEIYLNGELRRPVKIGLVFLSLYWYGEICRTVYVWTPLEQSDCSLVVPRSQPCKLRGLCGAKGGPA